METIGATGATSCNLRMRMLDLSLRVQRTEAAKLIKESAAFAGPLVWPSSLFRHETNSPQSNPLVPNLRILPPPPPPGDQGGGCLDDLHSNVCRGTAFCGWGQVVRAVEVPLRAPVRREVRCTRKCNKRPGFPKTHKRARIDADSCFCPAVWRRDPRVCAF